MDDKSFNLVSSVGIGVIGGLAVTAAYEVAVSSLLTGKMGFPSIEKVISKSFLTVPLTVAIVASDHNASGKPKSR